MKPTHKIFALAAAAIFAVSGAAPAFAHDPVHNPSVTAQDLRALLSGQLGEHVMLAASATGAALGGRDAQFKAAAKSLDDNSIDISKSIGAVYGQGAQDAFLPLWRKHIGFVVDYTTGLATKDKAKSDKAVTDLLQYAEDFGAFLSSANPNLPKAAVAGLVKDHIVGLRNVVDAQAAGDIKKQFAELRMAYMHMDMIGGALAGAIGKQFPDKFGGAADDAASDLRTGLNLLLSILALMWLLEVAPRWADGRPSLPRPPTRWTAIRSTCRRPSAQCMARGRKMRSCRCGASTSALSSTTRPVSPPRTRPNPTRP